MNVSSIPRDSLTEQAKTIIETVRKQDAAYSFFRPEGYIGPCFTVDDRVVYFQPPCPAEDFYRNLNQKGLDLQYWSRDTGTFPSWGA